MGAEAAEESIHETSSCDELRIVPRKSNISSKPNIMQTCSTKEDLQKGGPRAIGTCRATRIECQGTILLLTLHSAKCCLVDQI